MSARSGDRAVTTSVSARARFRRPPRELVPEPQSGATGPRRCGCLPIWGGPTRANGCTRKRNRGKPGRCRHPLRNTSARSKRLTKTPSPPRTGRIERPRRRSGGPTAATAASSSSHRLLAVARRALSKARRGATFSVLEANTASICGTRSVAFPIAVWAPRGPRRASCSRARGLAGGREAGVSQRTASATRVLRLALASRRFDATCFRSSLSSLGSNCHGSQGVETPLAAARAGQALGGGGPGRRGRSPLAAQASPVLRCYHPPPRRFRRGHRRNLRAARCAHSRAGGGARAASFSPYLRRAARISASTPCPSSPIRVSRCPLRRPSRRPSATLSAPLLPALAPPPLALLADAENRVKWYSNTRFGVLWRRLNSTNPFTTTGALDRAATTGARAGGGRAPARAGDRGCRINVAASLLFLSQRA